MTRNVLLHRHVWERVGGFDESLSLNEDYPFFLKALEYFPYSFASDAVVNWKPRSSYLDFFWQIHNYARGDAGAGIIRPKVWLLILRFALFCLLTLLFLATESVFLGSIVVLLCILYAVWSVAKHISRFPRGWYYFPVLQIVTDGAVLLGTAKGAIDRKN
ncbi:MAG: hypothetical protein H6774_00525 [Pseudomonadales bacterium]|nr:hypothetical protein [Pseudomonadales bacterium]